MGWWTPSEATLDSRSNSGGFQLNLYPLFDFRNECGWDAVAADFEELLLPIFRYHGFGNVTID